MHARSDPERFLRTSPRSLPSLRRRRSADVTAAHYEFAPFVHPGNVFPDVLRVLGASVAMCSLGALRAHRPSVAIQVRLRALRASMAVYLRGDDSSAASTKTSGAFQLIATSLVA